MWRRANWLAVLIVVPASVSAADNPRHIHLEPGLQSVTTVEQNWSDDESSWFYNVPQGSRLVPYDWFVHLEQVESPDRFLDPEHIRALGYIPRNADAGNPDALPIGFVRDAPYDDGTAGLGITCAACHTNQINVQGQAVLIDGAPSLGDFERFLKELALALQTTADDNAKFERFAAQVLPVDSTPAHKSALRTRLRSTAAQRTTYNERNLPRLQRDRFGPGRVDAFGAIFNEVSVTFLGTPENLQPANAPVSYPCLWDAPQHDRVQWNGAAENRVTSLGEFIFGTNEVGALGRNSGEVLGVFGNAVVDPHELLVPRRYASTVNKPNLMRIEQSLKRLWSPLWPEELLGPIDATRRDRGKALFQEHCVRCHAEIDRTDEARHVKARLSEVGTDKTMITNFGRQSKTGPLKGRQKTLINLDRFGESDATGAILKHMVERAILDPALPPFAFRNVLREVARSNHPLDLLDGLNPGFRMSATIDVGDRRLFGDFDSLVIEGGSVRISGGRFHLMERGHDFFRDGYGNDLVELRDLESVRNAVGRLAGVLKDDTATTAGQAKEPRVRLENAVVRIGYKARPLNGVWATAPYLHNGSVPSLAELLKPAAERAKMFHVGNREYDPVNVGFKNDLNQPLFDTTLPGNSNAGHEFGSNLSPEERRDLLEYLKAL